MLCNTIWILDFTGYMKQNQIVCSISKTNELNKLQGIVSQSQLGKGFYENKPKMSEM